MSGSNHIERYDSHVLETYYESIGAKLVGHVGSHRKWALPDGRVLPSCINGKSVATTAMARNAAVTLGMSLEEFREAVGYPTPRRHGKGAGKVATTEPATASKREALAACAAVQAAASGLHKATASGQRDGSYYRRVISAASKACRAIQEAAS